MLSPRQFVYHGTSNAGAANMKKGLKATGQKDPYGMGTGVYVTNSPQAAAGFGTEKGQYGWEYGPLGRQSREDAQGSVQGKRIGTTVVMMPRPGAQPLAQRPLNQVQNAGDPQAAEMLYHPQDLQIVGTQPINRTSVDRARYGSGWQNLQAKRQREATPPTLGDLKMRAQMRKSAQADRERIARGEYRPDDFN